MNQYRSYGETSAANLEFQSLVDANLPRLMEYPKLDPSVMSPRNVTSLASSGLVFSLCMRL